MPEHQTTLNSNRASVFSPNAFQRFGIALLSAIAPLLCHGWNEPADSLIRQIQANRYENRRLAQAQIEALYAMAEKQGDMDLFIEAISWETLVNYAQQNKGSKLSNRIDSLLETPEIKADSRKQSLLYQSLSISHIGDGDFSNAFRAAHRALLLAQENNDTSRIPACASTVGNICQYLQAYELGDQYYLSALRNISKESRLYANIHVNRSRLKYLLGQYDSAILLLRTAMPRFEAWKDTGFLILSHINMGSYFTGLQQPDSAIRYYRVALRLMQNIQNDNMRMTLYENIGNWYRDKGVYDTALAYYHQAQRMALADSNLSQYAQMAYAMSSLFMETDLSDSAYLYLNEYNKHLSRIQQPQTAESYQRYVDLVMESSQQLIKISEQEAKLKSKQFTITLILSASIVVVVTLFLLVTLERRRRMRQIALLREIENKELSDRLEHGKQIQQLQQEKVEQKSRELSSYSLLLANKNSLLKEIGESVEQLNSGNMEATKQKLVHLIKDSLRTDEDYWSSFSIHFTQVNPHFFENLDKRFPGLTPNEIKLCAYIKIGMSSKQIAQMLNLSPRSVITNRHRMRKKYGLAEDDDLDLIIKQL